MACRKHGYKGNKTCHACESSSNKFWGWVIVILILVGLFG